jgi:leucyl aminopeptidase
MSSALEIEFVPLTSTPEHTTVLLAETEGRLGPVGKRLDGDAHGALSRAMAAADFKGKSRSAIEVLGAGTGDIKRIIIAGVHQEQDEPGASAETLRLSLGGYISGQIAQRKTASASLVVELADCEGRDAADYAADLAAGAMLRSYKFDKYLTRKTPDSTTGGEASNGLKRLRVHVEDPALARTAFQKRSAVVDGIVLARDLVNEPANVLGPVEFADRLSALSAHGLEVEVMDVAQLEALGMRALLGVAQGSAKPARVVVMQWHGAKSKRAKAPLCFVGKGVTFDTGGISIKPAAGMEDMKGDMGGAACVSGLMLALAKRKAAVNAVGLVGLVENMPSANAQRPGDIVTALSGLTIEVLNTDAEGRLVLADVLHYAEARFKPKLIVDLATLTGAIMVALGKEYAGLFANDDKLADDLIAAGTATGEKVWRMPLDKAYDKMIDSRNADVKNIGGRNAGAITAAQFLQRFVKDTPWAHLDVAGVAMDSNRTDISQGWASGWGVRLLDRMVSERHEKVEK